MAPFDKLPSGLSLRVEDTTPESARFKVPSEVEGRSVVRGFSEEPSATNRRV